MSNTSKSYMLTTVDNPYSPLEDFDAWYAQDIILAQLNQRPSTCGLIDRLAGSSDYLTEEENNFLIQQAINDIIANDKENIYKRLEIPKSKQSLV